MDNSIIDPAMSALSDRILQATFFVYVVALVLSLFYYVRAQAIIARKRELEQSRELVAVGAGAAGDDAAVASGVAGRGVGSDAARDVADGDIEGSGVVTLGQEDLSRQQASARKWGGATQAVVWLGIILHIATVVTRGLAVGRIPLANLYEYVLMITALTMVVATVVVQSRGSKIVWPWLLTPMLVLMFFNATKLYSEAAPAVPALRSYWRPVHVLSVSIGASIGLVSGVFSLLFLFRVWQSVGGEHGFFGAVARPLPSAEKLDQIAYRLAVFTLPIFGIGIILGAIWAETAWGRPWGWDPKETFSFITWILYAAYLHARATAGWKIGAAWINIVAMGTMLFNLIFVNMVVSGLHSYAGLN